MALSTEARQKLTADIQRRQAELGLTFAEIARNSGVDPAQVSRICRGQFKTASQNVMQICIALGVPIDGTPPAELAPDADRQRLQAGVLAIWDRTPQDARRILRFLQQLAELRRTG